LSTPFQNRLVGTIIVAAAVVIFLPDILDGEKNSNQADFEAIPQAPAFEGSIEHKKFPTEKLDNIPKQHISDEVALDVHDEKGDENTSNEPKAAEENSELAVKTKSPDDVVEQLAPVKVDDSAVQRQESASEKKDKYAWVIHLGSFKHQKNVDELLRKLKSNGYTAFTQPIKTKMGTLTKVIVGPNLSKTDLEKKLPKLNTLTKVQGRIARFKVTK